MTGEHRAGLELYRRLFAYTRETVGAQFITLAEYVKQSVGQQVS